MEYSFKAKIEMQEKLVTVAPEVQEGVEVMCPACALPVPKVK